MPLVADRLRLLRRRKGLTQKDLGCVLGRNQAQISSWEKGMTRIPADELPRLAEILGVPVEDFFVTEVETVLIRVPADELPHLAKTLGVPVDALFSQELVEEVPI